MTQPLFALLIAAMSFAGWGTVTATVQAIPAPEAAEQQKAVIPVVSAPAGDVAVVTELPRIDGCQYSFSGVHAIANALQSGCVSITIEQPVLPPATLAVVSAAVGATVAVEKPNVANVSFNPYELNNAPQSSQQAAYTVNVLYAVPDHRTVSVGYAQPRVTMLYTIGEVNRMLETTLVLRC